MNQSHITQMRQAFHATLLDSILTVNEKGIPSNADGSQKASVKIAKSIIDQLGVYTNTTRLPGQSSGNQFESICELFLENTFLKFPHLRPGKWFIKKLHNKDHKTMPSFEQYSHVMPWELLKKLENLDSNFLSSLDAYLVTPDIVIGRETEEDEAINKPDFLVDEHTAEHASIRKSNNKSPLLHASISCKWTMRSDRAQNARTEALNLIRNRKGKLPHICVITGEPTPSRISSLAIGTGDVDCVYHFALPELQNALADNEYEDAEELLNIMVEGKRLRDISDLPLDLTV